MFLVEGTAINGAYMNDLKSNYIIPTLEFFSHTDEDQLGMTACGSSVDKSNVMYGVVLYRTAQAMPGTCCKTYGPFSSTQKLMNAIDNLELTGGKSESYANLAEGMAVALHCFEDFSQIRSTQRGTASSSSSPLAQSSAQKHCIMICNSAPYSMPVPVNANPHQPMDMKNYEQLATVFHEVVSTLVTPHPHFERLFAPTSRTTSTCRFSRRGRSPFCSRSLKRPAVTW